MKEMLCRWKPFKTAAQNNANHGVLALSFVNMRFAVTLFSFVPWTINTETYLHVFCEASATYDVFTNIRKFMLKVNILTMKTN